MLRGLGGAGGGAVELLALNDLTIGVIGSVAVDGGDGTADWDSGGGGGSGGSVVIAAGGAVRHAGAISARGGNGGRTLRPLSKNAGGGGAGGRVVLYGQSVEVVGGEGADGEERGTVDVGGGRCVAGGERKKWLGSVRFATRNSAYREGCGFFLGCQAPPTIGLLAAQGSL